VINRPPKIRHEGAAGDSVPLEATIAYDGRLRVKSDPDDCRLNGAWFTSDEAREFALELIGLADAADAIHGK
jgi:hypothetical protein